MADQTLGLDRQVLSQFLPNHEAIRAFERLFQQVTETIPDSITNIDQSSGNAQATASQALADLSEVAAALALLLSGPPVPDATQQGAYEPPFALVLPDEYPPPADAQSVPDIYIPPAFPYDPSAVSITGGTVRAALTDSTTNLIASSVALANGAGVGAGTITNAPAAGNPTKWVPVNDNGVVRYVPLW